MIYSKLPIVFLSTMASEKNGSTNSVIASYILEHIDEMQEVGIKDLANRCNVAVSSISRFCKEIGLRDYIELKEMLTYANLHFEQVNALKNGQERLSAYGARMQQSIDVVQNSLSLPKIITLCKDINRFQKVAIFGLLKAETVAMNLQSDLLMLNKQVFTKVAYSEQLKYIEQADKETLILIFSYTGAYFEYQNRKDLPANIKNAKIYMITSERIRYPDYIDEVITFHSKKDQFSHPIQLAFIGTVIAQEYARLFS